MGPSLKIIIKSIYSKIKTKEHKSKTPSNSTTSKPTAKSQALTNNSPINKAIPHSNNRLGHPLLLTFKTQDLFLLSLSSYPIPIDLILLTISSITRLVFMIKIRMVIVEWWTHHHHSHNKNNLLTSLIGTKTQLFSSTSIAPANPTYSTPPKQPPNLLTRYNLQEAPTKYNPPEVYLNIMIDQMALTEKPPVVRYAARTHRLELTLMICMRRSRIMYSISLILLTEARDNSNNNKARILWVKGRKDRQIWLKVTPNRYN